MVQLSPRLLCRHWPRDPLGSFVLEIRVDQEQSMISTEMQQSVSIVCTLGTDSEPTTQMHFHLRVHITSQDYDVRNFCTVAQSRKFPIGKLAVPFDKECGCWKFPRKLDPYQMY